MAATPPVPVRVERHDDVAVVVLDNPPVNATSAALRQALLDVLAGLALEPDLRGVVLAGAGRGFVAGADIAEFDGPPREPQMPAVLGALDDFPLPVVAALHGHALGGGLELALACDVRLCTPDAVVGLPEVTLGIIPGAGGTVRLPRLVGVVEAVRLIGTGRLVGAAEARELGIVDDVVEGDLRAAAVARARAATSRDRVRDRPLPAGDPAAVARARDEAVAVSGDRPHVHDAADAVERAVVLSVEEALRRERATFERLRGGAEAAAHRHLFFARRGAARRARRWPGAATPVGPVLVAGSGARADHLRTLVERLRADPAGPAVVLVADDDPAVRAAALERAWPGHHGVVAVDPVGWVGPLPTEGPSGPVVPVHPAGPPGRMALLEVAPRRGDDPGVGAVVALGHALGLPVVVSPPGGRLLGYRVSGGAWPCEPSTTAVRRAVGLLDAGAAGPDVDLAAVEGHGFPRHLGGPLWWAVQGGAPAALGDDVIEAVRAALWADRRTTPGLSGPGAPGGDDQDPPPPGGR